MVESFAGFLSPGNVGGDPLSHILPHPLKVIEAHLPGPLTPNGVITVLSDQIVMMIASGLLLMIFMPLFVRKRRDDTETGRLVTTGAGNFIEMVCQYLRDDVARPSLGKHTDRFIKYLWSVFFFILTMNLIGLVPFGSVTPKIFNGLHIGGTPTTNIYITATLAILTFILMVFNGLRFGGKDYIAHFAPGPWWIAPLIVPVEIIGTVAKVVALALRLFAANVAGHILVAVLIGLIVLSLKSLGMVFGLPVALIVVAGSVVISMVEIFVAFLQAFIFTYLSSLFIGMSVNLHHDDDHAEAGAH
ncbi:MAG: F0F1 ATP synthase subunit A [Acidobacteriota bacterium]